MKKRKIRVFISYNYEHATIVEMPEDAFTKSIVKTDYLPFLSEREHNETIREAIQKVKKADVIIVIPGNRETTSFMEAEVLAGVGLNKMFLILKTDSEQRLPSTAYTGYPHFSLNNLQGYNFKPLKLFITRIFFHISSTSFIGKAMLASIGNFVKGWYVLLGGLLLFVGTLLPLALPELSVYVQSIIFIIFFLLILGVAGAYIINYFMKQRRLTKLVREGIASNSSSYSQLSRIFSAGIKEDKEIMDCLVKSGLQRD